MDGTKFTLICVCWLKPVIQILHIVAVPIDSLHSNVVCGEKMCAEQSVFELASMNHAQMARLSFYLLPDLLYS